MRQFVGRGIAFNPDMAKPECRSGTAKHFFADYSQFLLGLFDDQTIFLSLWIGRSGYE